LAGDPSLPLRGPFTYPFVLDHFRIAHRLDPIKDQILDLSRKRNHVKASSAHVFYGNVVGLVRRRADPLGRCVG
jgi:hypothetical protein